MSGYFRPSPWAREALTPDEIAGLHARIAALDCLVTVERSDSGWTIYAADRAVVAKAYRVRSPLAAAIHSVLDDYRAQRVEVDADVARYTPEEILTIAHQSGVVR